MYKRILPIALAGMTACALAMGVSACSGGGDDDDAASPTPTPVNPDYCLILWANQSTVADRFDIYFWQTGVELMNAGAGAYQNGTSVRDSSYGFFFYRAELSSTGGIVGQEVLGVSTSGAWALNSITGVEPGNTIDYEDTTSQQYFDGSGAGALGAAVASDGTGTFAGTLTDPDADEVIQGTGSITVAVNGTDVTMGAISYAICDQSSTFAPGQHVPLRVPVELFRSK